MSKPLYLDRQVRKRVLVLKDPNLLEWITGWSMCRELTVVNVKPVDVLHNDEALGVKYDDWGETEAEQSLLGDDPDEASRDEEDERQPTMVRNAPSLRIFIHFKI